MLAGGAEELCPTQAAVLVRPNQETMSRVMGLSLVDAGIGPQDVDYVSVHGTGAEHGDIAEVQATLKALGCKPISSLKSYTGHTLGLCGAFEAWASVMMRESWLAPTLNFSEVDECCTGLDYIIGKGRKNDVNIIMSNNFAFGGVNKRLASPRDFLALC